MSLLEENIGVWLYSSTGNALEDKGSKIGCIDLV